MSEFVSISLLPMTGSLDMRYVEVRFQAPISSSRWLASSGTKPHDNEAIGPALRGDGLGAKEVHSRVCLRGSHTTCSEALSPSRGGPSILPALLFNTGRTCKAKIGCAR